ncbi:MAG: hypothetical protein IT342_27280 [Candidatus Melainabacteria bacterium]|nr:hypothetical protein [Candidatus Melainabacteria bacterium]
MSESLYVLTGRHCLFSEAGKGKFICGKTVAPQVFALHTLAFVIKTESNTNHFGQFSIFTTSCKSIANYKTRQERRRKLSPLSLSHSPSKQQPMRITGRSSTHFSVNQRLELS